MNLLVPKFHPVAGVCIIAFFILCLFFGGEPNSDVVQAAWPLVAAGAALAAGVTKSIIDAKAEKKAAEAQAAAEEKRMEIIEEEYGPQVEEAKKRLADPESYELSEATKREKLEQVQRDLEAQSKDAELELLRSSQLPYGSGKQFQMMDDLQKRRANALAGARLGLERDSDLLAESKRSADQGMLIDFAKTKAGMPSTVTPVQGVGSRLMGQLGGAIMAGASSGLFGTMGGGGGSTATTTDPELAIDQKGNV